MRWCVGFFFRLKGGYKQGINYIPGPERVAVDSSGLYVFVVDEDVCTRCALCVDRCPTGVIILGKTGVAPRDGDRHQRDNNHGYAYGMRF